ncbi:hypothetical protein AAV96_08910 [Acinetobacter sp. AG1]|uniref:helix-turn-helix domain-containing protein n=1 Tax=Acinetobacter TaxID=469 RepID=UPI000629631B|nr:helix-turn-helix domain-containing protein [Acinetobacter sp. AG1]KKW79013.1 hypothetical protein AAV96_08910 [Acinetobacter sp. AG1]
MLNINVEQAYFMTHVKPLGINKVTWDKNGKIISMQRDTHCIFRFDQVVVLWSTWLASKSSGIILLEHDIDEAIKEFGTANKKIITHIENIIAQKALISSKGNQSSAADQIGMSRTKLRYVVKRFRSSSILGTAA